MLHLLLFNLLAILIYMTLWFIAARRRGRLDTVDNAWGFGYMAIAIATAIHAQTRALYLIGWLVLLWATRLTMHIAGRNARRPEDPRYAAIASKWGNHYWLRAYFSIFLLQGVLIWIIGLPISLSGYGPLPLNHLVLPIIGTIMWAAGQWIEAAADDQLKTYLAGKPKKNQVLDTGLWRYSRHPNYFGEILQWYGIAVVACVQPYGWIGLLGPTVLYLTIRYASGVPPIENKRKDNKAYQAYAARTSVLIPLPPKR